MTAILAAIKAAWVALFGRGQAPVSAVCSAADSLSQRIITCATTVSDTLGSGLSEVIYENALAHELRKAGLRVCQKQAVVVCYDGMIVGDYTADLSVEDTVLIELKAVKGRAAFDTAQCSNYLKATGRTRSVLLNFGDRGLRAQCMANGSRSMIRAGGLSEAVNQAIK